MDPGQVSAQKFLATLIGRATYVLMVVALAGVLMGGQIGRSLDGIVVVTFALVPWLRVLWLVRRWQRIGDKRFALAGTLLIGIALAGVMVSFLVA
ncbi:MAG: hypothetical protein RLZZ518_186 [Actinomycetota bacterium]